MSNIAIIGAGISGLSIAHLFLEKKNKVVLYEREKEPGGLIRCKRINGSLFHICGGHVFNSKRADVLNWFWQHFDKNNDFIKADRNSIVFINDEQKVPYPIENHMYMFEENIQKTFINDLIQIANAKQLNPTNFEEFLKGRFGQTLYNLYFKPYNEKVWRRDLSTVPLSWLEGKLPMPTVEEMIYNNMNHVEEKQFVHSTFWYEKNNGSQYLIDTLTQGLDIHYEFKDKICYNKKNKKWKIQENEYDKVIFCGNIKTLLPILEGITLDNYESSIDALESHGTTSVFCEIEKNPYSWIYMPSTLHLSHRIICTGNFSETNNLPGKMTGTVEFTDEISKEDILDNLSRIPLNPHYIDHHYSKYTYPIQNKDTRKMIHSMKNELSHFNFYMTGRFADWEYYNMDMAIASAMDLVNKINC